MEPRGLKTIESSIIRFDELILINSFSIVYSDDGVFRIRDYRCPIAGSSPTLTWSRFDFATSC